jgi:hypothetical protein
MKRFEWWLVTCLVLLLFCCQNAIATNYDVTLSYTKIGVFKDFYSGTIIKASLCMELPLLKKAILKWDYPFNMELYSGGKLYFEDGKVCSVDAVYSKKSSSNIINYQAQIEEIDRQTALLNAETAKMQQQLEWLQYEAKFKEELINISKTTPSVSTEIEYENTQEALNATAEAIYKVYPFLDVNNSKANYKAIEAVRSRTVEYVNAGYTQATSLLNAANDIGPLYNIQKKKRAKK